MKPKKLTKKIKKMALPQRSYRDTKEIEIDGVDFEVEFTFEAAERQTYLDPGSDAFVVINKMFVTTEDQNGNDVKIDIAPYLHVEVDEESLAEDILEDLKD